MSAPPAFTSVLAVFLSLFLLTAPSRTQELCGMRESAHGDGAPFGKLITQHSGCHLPTAGTVRGLVLFIQTGADNVNDEAWPLGRLPVWAETYRTAMHQYYHDMSNGAVDLQLDLYPEALKTHGSEGDYYWTLRNFGHATKDILKELDQSMSFAPYDNWNSFNRAYNVISPGEGRIDLIIAIYRRVEDKRFMPYSGVSDLGFVNYLFVDSTRHIYGGTGQSNDAGASGITLCSYPGSGMVTSLDFAYRVSIHELMHKFSGEGHPADIFGGLGVLSANSGGVALNSFERHLLGYIDFHEITPHVDTTIVMRDYLTENSAYLLPIPEAPEALYYSFEFRAKKSPHDTAPGKGVYIYRVYDSWSKNQKELRIMDSRGNFDWALDSTTGKLYRLRPNALGGANVYQKISINNMPYWAEGWMGDPSSAFTPASGLLTVFHNPTPDFIWRRDTIRTGLFIRVTDMTDSTATLDISYHPPAILSAERRTATDFRLHPVYPNPVTGGRGVATVSVPAASHIRLFLTDMLGRRIATLADGLANEGTHAFSIETRGLPKGPYHLVLENGRTTDTRVVILAD